MMALRHVALFVADLQAAEAYYQSLFAMQLIGREAQLDDGQWYTLPFHKGWDNAETAGIVLGMTALRHDNFALVLFRGEAPPGQVFAIGLSLPEADLTSLRERLPAEADVLEAGAGGGLTPAGFPTVLAKEARMSANSSFQRFAAAAAIASMPLSLAATVLVTLAVDFNFDLMNDPVALVTLGAQAAGTFRLGEAVGVFGYYLLYLPAALYLWQWLRPRAPGWLDLSTAFGLGAIFIGVVGAALRATVIPSMMTAYAQAGEAQREALASSFQLLAAVVFDGIGALEYILFGVWWLGVGLALQAERRWLGVCLTLLGACYLLAGAGYFLQVPALRSLEGIVFLVLPVWALWLGITLWRVPGPSQPALSAGPA